MILISALALIPVLAAGGWIRTYEINQLSIGRSVRQTADGGYIIAGQCGDENQCDVLLIKTDSLGDTMWIRVYGGSGSDLATCVQNTNDGGYIVTGHLSVLPWLLKVKPNGDTTWTRTYGYGGANWVEETSDGGYILTGRIDDAYLWLLKTDNDGDILWEKKYQWGWVSEIGYCVRQAWDGGYIVATNMGLFKTDANGDSVWLKSFPSGCVEQTLDGGYIQATSHYADIWIIKTDSDGDTVWTKTYGGPKEDYSYDVHQTTDGGYIIVGETRSFGAGNYDVWLLKTDSLGDTLWTRTFGEGQPDEAYSCQQTSDSGYIITGVTGSFGVFFGGVLLIKTDSLGRLPPEVSPVEIIEPQPNEWPLVVPEAIFYNFSSSSVAGGVVCRITDLTNGEVIYSDSIPKPFFEPFDSTLAVFDSAFLALGPYQVTFYAIGNPPGSLFSIPMSITVECPGVEEHASNEPVCDVITCPGPKITLRYTNHPQGFSASIFDALGRKVDELHSASSSGTITWGEGFGPGVYFIQEIKSGSGEKVSRVILLH